MLPNVGLEEVVQKPDDHRGKLGGVAEISYCLLILEIVGWPHGFTY
jgi:hypothetical protein